jgi:phage-related protein
VHELRIPDETTTWRIFYQITADAIVIAEVTDKKTRSTPLQVIANCRSRLRRFHSA